MESERKRSSFYYLMRDILACFPDNFENNFLGIINHHLRAKQASRQILLDEVKKSKPHFRVMAGALIIQRAFLRQNGRAALYEVIDITSALKFCFRKARFKTVRKLAAEVILRLFAKLYFEYIIMPGRREEGKEYLDKFKNCFSIQDVIDVINTNGVFPRFIFEEYGIVFNRVDSTQARLKEILVKFYPDSTFAQRD